MLLSACLLLSGQVHAANSPPSVQFDLKAQPLEDALSKWSDQSGLQLICPRELLVSARRSAKVSGNFAPGEALFRLLEGTGLTYSFVDPETVKISSTGAPAISTPIAPIAEVVVTGTHIRGVTPAGARIIVLDQVDIRRSGYTTVEQLLQSLPQNIRSGDHGESADARLTAGSGASGNVSFGSSMNLRGLGSTGTLTLINGHRIAPSGQGFITDISHIPLDAISRIEVLTDGASAVYGADAIGGVVNIILKEDFEGADTRIRYGFTKPSGRDEVGASQTLGATWAGGSILFLGSYLDQTQLSVEERPYTSGVVQPASIFPTNRQLGGLVSAHQELGDSFSMRANAHVVQTRRRAFGSATPGHFEFPAEIDRANASTSLHFSGVEGWDIALNGHISREDIGFGVVHFPLGVATSAGASQLQNLVQNQWIAGLSANGKLGDPAADVGLAFGALHREESYTREQARPRIQGQNAGRTVNAAYLELHVPMFGEVKGIPGAKRMNVSLAGRYDEYSDVGDIANPRFGVSWTPIAGLEIRSTYSKSFRAAAVGSELLMASRGTSPQVFVYSFRTADGSETIPVAFLTGSKKLRPERARNWTAGISVRPTRIEGLQFDVTYYDIVYSDRIIAPPLDQDALSNPALQTFIERYGTTEQLQAALALQTRGEVAYIDRTGSNFDGGAFGPNPQNLATHSYDARTTNAGILKTSGFDLAVNYSTRLMAGDLDLALHANYIDQMETILTPGAPALELVGTTANPAGLRLRTIAAYSREGWDAALAVNYTSGYTDTSTEVDVPVGSYTTADATLSYTFSSSGERPTKNLSVQLSVTNLSNRKPPYIRGSLATRGANYDSVNADPTGRSIAVEVWKKW